MHIIANFCHDVAWKDYVLSGCLLEGECHHHKMWRRLLLPEIPQRPLLYFARSIFKRCNHETFQVCSLDLKISLMMIVVWGKAQHSACIMLWITSRDRSESDKTSLTKYFTRVFVNSSDGFITRKTCTLLHYNLLLHPLYWFYFYFSTNVKKIKVCVVLKLLFMWRGKWFLTILPSFLLFLHVFFVCFY